MATYSHSRISTYENCPYKYKLQYIDKIKPDIPTTIEAFMGNIVHETLEKLYKEKELKNLIDKQSLIRFYKDLWDKNYTKDILIVKADQGLTAKDYKRKGESFVSNYYERMAPFEEMTILGLETENKLTLSDGNQWHVRIDKLGKDDEGNYFVCDYKTNSRMKNQKDADEDRQLALYSIWVKDNFKDVKSVKLIWHMLAFNTDATSERTDEELTNLHEEVVEKIKEIETTNKFPTKVTGLCNYCGFKSICPKFGGNKEQKILKQVEMMIGERTLDEWL
jgi:putative RecB family exonuclease